MAGSADNDDDLPNLSENEDLAESTIAMEAPSFELPSNIPSPISSPPPPVDVRPVSKPLIVVPPPKPASARFPVAAATVPDRAEPPNDPPTRLVKAPSRELLEKDEPPLRPSQKSPLASTAFADEAPDEIETRAVSRAEIDEAQGLPSLSSGESEPEEEPTRAVNKQMLRPLQDAHVVVGYDAIGDEATVAVPAGANLAANAANSGIAAALRETLGQPDEQPTFPPPPGPRAAVAGAVGPPVARPHQPTALGMAPPAPPPWLAQQQPMPPPPSMGGQRISNPGLPPMSAPYPQSGPMPAMQTSAAPYPPAHPSMPQQPPPQMHAMGPHGTMMHPGGPSQAPIPWQPGPPEPKQGFLEQLFGRPVPGQMILLVAVGTVCLAIFITGIVLFAKTKM